MAGNEKRNNEDDGKQKEKDRSPPHEDTQPDVETQQHHNNHNHDAPVDAATEKKKENGAIFDDDADTVEMEAAFAPELSRVYRAPGAFREGGDNSSPLEDSDSDNDDLALNSTSRTRMRMQQQQRQQTGAFLRPAPETLVSATLVTEDTLMGNQHTADSSLHTVFGVPMALPGDDHSLPPQPSLHTSRKKCVVRRAGMVGVVALVVGLSLALVMSNKSSSSKSNNTSVVAADDKEVDSATFTNVTTPDTLVNNATTDVTTDASPSLSPSTTTVPVASAEKEDVDEPEEGFSEEDEIDEDSSEEDANTIDATTDASPSLSPSTSTTTVLVVNAEKQDADEPEEGLSGVGEIEEDPSEEDETEKDDDDASDGDDDASD